MPKPFSRKGLHRLECQHCDGFLYATVAQLEKRGLPMCWCGATLQPCTLDLAMLLDAEDSRPLIEYRRECNSVARGQASHGRRGRQLRGVEEIAAERVETARRDAASVRRRSALHPVHVDAMPF